MKCRKWNSLQLVIFFITLYLIIICLSHLYIVNDKYSTSEVYSVDAETNNNSEGAVNSTIGEIEVENKSEEDVRSEELTAQERVEGEGKAVDADTYTIVQNKSEVIDAIQKHGGSHVVDPNDWTVIYNTPFFGHQKNKIIDDCDIPCRWTSTLEKTTQAVVYSIPNFGNNPPESHEHLLKIAFSMEGAHKYHVLNNLKKFDAEMTYRWTSDILKPYYETRFYNIQTPATDFKTAIHGATFIARNCQNDRVKMMQGLQKHIRVDSLSTCMKNTVWDPNIRETDKMGMQRRYLFHLAWENGELTDYVTEKVYHALQAGTLPVYHGAPNIDEYVPPGSIIKLSDYADTDKLGEYLHYLEGNETAYNEYHVWRYKPLPSWFVKKFEFTSTLTDCRVCRWVYAKRYGLLWDHASQTFS
eukprot:CFRG2227T1